MAVKAGNREKQGKKWCAHASARHRCSPSHAERHSPPQPVTRSTTSGKRLPFRTETAWHSRTAVRSRAIWWRCRRRGKRRPPDDRSGRSRTGGRRDGDCGPGNHMAFRRPLRPEGGGLQHYWLTANSHERPPRPHRPADRTERPRSAPVRRPASCGCRASFAGGGRGARPARLARRCRPRSWPRRCCAATWCWAPPSSPRTGCRRTVSRARPVVTDGFGGPRVEPVRRRGVVLGCAAAPSLAHGRPKASVAQIRLALWESAQPCRQFGSGHGPPDEVALCLVAAPFGE